MGFNALKHNLIKRRARNPPRKLLPKDSAPLRNGPGVAFLASLSCDHKNGSVSRFMRLEQKRDKCGPSICSRLAVKIDARFRNGLPLFHASKFLLIHAKRWPAGTWHRRKGRRRLLADAKFRNFEGLSCVRAGSFLGRGLRDLSFRLLVERLGAVRNELPKTLFLRAGDARLAAHCQSACSALPARTVMPMFGGRLAPERPPSTGGHASSSAIAAGQRFIPLWQSAASSGLVHPCAGQMSRRASVG